MLGRRRSEWTVGRTPRKLQGCSGRRIGHSCALRTDGTIACWGEAGGNPDNGITQVPAGTYKAITARYDYSCALSVAGAITCWGEHAVATRGMPFEGFRLVYPGGGPPPSTIKVLPRSGADVKTITAEGDTGDFFRFARAELGAGFRMFAAEGRTLPAAGGFIWLTGPDFKAITAVEGRTCALRDDSTIACWGINNERFRPPSGTYRAIGRTCALRDNGTLACWGINNYNGEADTPAGPYKT